MDPARGDARRTGLLDQLLGWARTSLGAAPAAEAPAQSPLSGADLLGELFDGLNEEIALIDDRGAVLTVNAALRATLPDAAPPPNMGYLDLCGRISPDLDSDTFRARFAELLDGRILTLTYPFDAGAGRSRRMRRIRLRRVASLNGAILVAIHEDLKTASAQSSATSEMLTAQDEERQRIAMELHDSTSQHLTALGLGVARLRRIMGDGAQDVLEDMSRSVTEVMREIRIMSFLMRPPGLERQQLEATARNFVQGFGVRTGLKASFTSVGGIDQASPAAQHAAFRIIQEALSNVFRHAAATSVEVEVSISGGDLVLRVADDGRGIAGLKGGDMSRVPLGVGLIGMRTRVTKLGGRLRISCKGGGTRIVAMLPAGVATQDSP